MLYALSLLVWESEFIVFSFTNKEARVQEKLPKLEGVGGVWWQPTDALMVLIIPLPPPQYPSCLCKPLFSCLDDPVLSFIKPMKSSLLLSHCYSDKPIYDHILMGMWATIIISDIVIKCFLFHLHWKMITFSWWSFTVHFPLLSVAKVTSQFHRQTHLPSGMLEVCGASGGLLTMFSFFQFGWHLIDPTTDFFFKVLTFKHLPPTRVQSWRLVFTVHTVTPFITTDFQPSQGLEFNAGPCTLSLILPSPSALFLQFLRPF